MLSHPLILFWNGIIPWKYKAVSRKYTWPTIGTINNIQSELGCVACEHNVIILTNVLFIYLPTNKSISIKKKVIDLFDMYSFI